MAGDGETFVVCYCCDIQGRGVVVLQENSVK
jgi:hypothetical protein